ncbi:MAG TPA: hypothetical protein VGZ31_05310 [Chthoniobacterales bacterium]|jgi:hypothetical protein|nr:hypothetical protein [Chthoniobacterales bacterium]
MSYRFFSNLCFLLFAAMLVSSLLISIVAAARSLRRRAKTHGTELTSAAAPPVGGRLADVLLLIAVAATWYNVSSGWIAEFTIYPIYADMSQFGPQAFHGFSRAYLSRLPIIILPAGIMFLSWSVLLWIPCRGVPSRHIWLAIALCTAFVASTPLAAGAQDQMYSGGFSQEMYSRLLWSNGARAIIFTLTGLVALRIVYERWHQGGRADA